MPTKQPPTVDVSDEEENTIPPVTGKDGYCTAEIAVVSGRYVRISIYCNEQLVEMTKRPRDHWVTRSGRAEIAQNVAEGSPELSPDTIDAALGIALTNAMEQWNWRSFMIPDIETAFAPSYDHLNSLTDPTECSVPGNYPTTKELRCTLRERVHDTMRNRRYRVINSPTGSGKSFTNATERWLDLPDVTGGKQVVHLSPTIESRQQSVEDSKKTGRKYHVLKGREEACPVARGDHDNRITVDGKPASQWLAQMCELRGFTFSDAKARLEEVNDQGCDQLPCRAGNEKCPAQAQWDAVRDSLDGDPEFDVIHCTHQLAFVPKLRYETNLIFDEQPSFAKIGPGDETGGRGDSGVNHEQIFASVTAFLKEAEAPIETAEELITVAKQDAAEVAINELHDEFPELYDAFNHRPDHEWYFDHPNAHTAARAFTEALWDAARQNPDPNGRRVSEVSHHPPNLATRSTNEEVPNRQWITTVLNEDNTITTLRILPDMGTARSVIGFDAYPVEQLWWLNVGEGMQVDNLLDEYERRLWRRFERRLCVIQMGRGAYSYTNEKRFNRDKASVVINSLREQYGSCFRTAITARSVEDQVGKILEKTGVTNPDTMHPGDVESRNDFKGETTGLVLGCIDPGDDYVLDIIAELSYDARPERGEEDCNSCGGKGCAHCDSSGKERAFGRGFVGPNADDATDILANVRENQVAQAIGRYARKPDDSDDWAVVFALTNAIPDELTDFHGPKVWTYGPKQQVITESISEHGEATAKQITGWINENCETVDSCSKEHVRQTMQKHIEHGNVSVDQGAGAYSADLYRWEANEGMVSTTGAMNFQMEQIIHSEKSLQAPQVPQPGVDQIS